MQRTTSFVRGGTFYLITKFTRKESGMKKLLTLIALTVVIGSGCNSIRTTALDRSENGALSCAPESSALKGVPVMLRVPTHIEVKIYQRDFWYQNTGSNKLVLVPNQLQSRYVKTEIKRTEQMFVVDPKRPAAGTGTYGFTFSSAGENSPNPGHGYLTGIQYKADDETLLKSASLVNSIASALLAPTPASPGTNSSALKRANEAEIPTVSTDRLIKMKRFDLNSPSIDSDIKGFLDANLNNCNSCANEPAYSN